MCHVYTCNGSSVLNTQVIVTVAKVKYSLNVQMNGKWNKFVLY